MKKYNRKAKGKVIKLIVNEEEETVIKNKASLLGMDVNDYIRDCCIFNWAISDYINDRYAHSSLTQKNTN
jgi:predicted DNA binding CopG/RHH family protein